MLRVCLRLEGTRKSRLMHELKPAEPVRLQEWSSCDDEPGASYGWPASFLHSTAAMGFPGQSAASILQAAGSSRMRAQEWFSEVS